MTLAVPGFCMLPPALVAGGLVLARPVKAEGAEALPAHSPASGGALGVTAGGGGAAGENPVEEGALSAPLVLVSPIERSETVVVRPPLSHASGLALAGGRARLRALRAAAEALPNRRDIRMGAVRAEERLALAAHLYRAVNTPKAVGTPRSADNGLARAEVRLEVRPAAAAGMSHILHSFDLMQMRLQLLRESAALLQLMNSRLLPETRQGAAGPANPDSSGGPAMSASPDGSDGSVFGRSAFRAPVSLPDVGGHGEQRGNAHKNALDELFSGRAGTGMGARRPPPAVAVSPGRTEAKPDFTGGVSGAASVPASAVAAATAAGEGDAQLVPSGSVASANTVPKAAPPLQTPPPALSDEVWAQSHWSLAARRLQAMFDVQDMLVDADPDGWLVQAGDLPLLEQAALLVPDSPSVWLLLAEAQMRHDLPLQSVTSCDAALDLDSGLSRARYIRALGHLRLQQLALAEADLTVSLARRHGIEPQGEDRARRLRARGAVRMQRQDTAGMCEDFSAACALGDCEGLVLVRAQGQCLPPAIVKLREAASSSANGEEPPAAGQEIPPVPQKTDTPLPGGIGKRK